MGFGFTATDAKVLDQRGRLQMEFPKQLELSQSLGS
jgi:hypothetical protein